MKPRVSRRAMVQSLTAGIVTSAACSKQAPLSPEPATAKPEATATKLRLPVGRVNLIFHGMMAFVCRAETMLVYIPSPGTAHDVRVGGLGGQKLPDTPTTNRQYRIDFGGLGDSGTVYDVNAANEVKFALGNSLQMDWANIYCSIQVPRPSRVRLFRVMSHVLPSTDPFYDGAAQRTFNINPSTIPTVHVFTYDVISNTVNLLDQSSTPVPIAGMPGDSNIPVRNIHVYSEPPKTVPKGEDHLPMFCGMLRDSPTSHIQLTRTSVVARPLPPIEQEPMGLDDFDLSRYDISSLSELAGIKRAGDPADCINGWVY
jgi:hypothetical protein